MRDMAKKKRTGVSIGSANKATKLSEEDVLEIRRCYDGSYGCIKKIGDRFKISRNGVMRIVNREYWTHL